MRRIIEGCLHFQRYIYPKQRELFQKLGSGQKPHALFITCADSRVNPALITQTEPGEVFVVRNVGNIVPPHGETTGGVSSAIEFAVIALEVNDIVVFGHSDCGAMKALIHPENLEKMPTVATWLHHAECARHVVQENYPPMDETAQLRALTEENILAQMEHLKTHPSVAARRRRGTLGLHGWFYDIRTGEIRIYDGNARRFVILDEETAQTSLAVPAGSANGE